MLLNTGPELVQSSHGLLSTLAFQLGPGAPPNYALEGSIAIAGQGISWLRDRMGFIESAGAAGAGLPASLLVGPSLCPTPQQIGGSVQFTTACCCCPAHPRPPAPPRPTSLQPTARRWRAACPTAAAFTLCPPLAACWRPGGRTMRGASSWASRSTAQRYCRSCRCTAWLHAVRLLSAGAASLPWLLQWSPHVQARAALHFCNSPYLAPYLALPGRMQAHIVRAMLEAICFQTLDVLAAMQQDADCSELRVMFVDGGASQNSLLMQVGPPTRSGAGRSLHVGRQWGAAAAGRHAPPACAHPALLACLMPVHALCLPVAFAPLPPCPPACRCRPTSCRCLCAAPPTWRRHP